ncbi:MAG: hypothetical protein GY793_10925 [Proteobacteria bacterium]|nr:hypothetical protein [Pseudomonadota bacterium]
MKTNVKDVENVENEFFKILPSAIAAGQKLIAKVADSSEHSPMSPDEIANQLHEEFTFAGDIPVKMIEKFNESMNNLLKEGCEDVERILFGLLGHSEGSLRVSFAEVMLRLFLKTFPAGRGLYSYLSEEEKEDAEDGEEEPKKVVSYNHEVESFLGEDAPGCAIDYWDGPVGAASYSKEDLPGDALEDRLRDTAEDLLLGWDGEFLNYLKGILWWVEDDFEFKVYRKNLTILFFVKAFLKEVPQKDVAEKIFTVKDVVDYEDELLKAWLIVRRT